MKIALFGTTGTIGRRIAREALTRGHAVTAVVRAPAVHPATHDRGLLRDWDVGGGQ